MIRAFIGLGALATSALAFSCSIKPVQISLQADDTKSGISLEAQSKDAVFGISIARSDTESWGDLPGGATDLLLLGPEISIKDYEVRKVDDGPGRGNTNGTIGVGLNSTFIQYLKDEDEIPARSYGLSYSPGAKSPSALQADSIVLGGYDKAAIDGKIYESKLGIDGLGINVEIKQMTITGNDGQRTDLLKVPIRGVLNTEINQILMPSGIAMDYSSIAGASQYDERHLRDFRAPPMLEPESYSILQQTSPFTGSLEVTLSNGFTATIPAELLSGEFISSDSPKSSISSVLPVRSFDHMVLGTVFLSQAYLGVDYENMQLLMAKRASKSSKNSQLEALGCDFEETKDSASNQRSHPSSIPTATAAPQVSQSQEEQESSSSPKPSKNVILGAVLGSLLGLIAILLLILFFIKRHKKNQRAGYQRRSLHSIKGLGYHQYSEASNSRLLSTDHVPVKREEAAIGGSTEFPGTFQPPPPPARASLTPSLATSRRTDGPGRNSYFKEDLDT